MDDKYQSGIASQASHDRGHSPERKGRGEKDPDEIRKLITLLREVEAKENPATRDIQIGEFLVDGSRVPSSFIEALQSLTKTEATVIRFLGWGRSNADIAILLGINENTVRTHFNNAVQKLEVDGMRALNSMAGLLFHSTD